MLGARPAAAVLARAQALDEPQQLHKNLVDETWNQHKMRELPLPSAFHPALTGERLALVSQWLLEELYATEEDLSRSTDNGYTRGCTTFGRQRNRLITEALSGSYDWLQLRNSANDLVFEIGGVPCRFSNDDPGQPSKDAVLTASRYQRDFLEFATGEEPGRYCFVIDRGSSDAEEPRVVLLGFTASGEKACMWESGAVRVLRLAADLLLPAAVEIARPQVAPKRNADGQADSAAA